MLWRDAGRKGKGRLRLHVIPTIPFCSVGLQPLLLCLDERVQDGAHLRRGLALSKDDLCKAGAALSIRINSGKAADLALAAAGLFDKRGKGGVLVLRRRRRRRRRSRRQRSPRSSSSSSSSSFQQSKQPATTTTPRNHVESIKGSFHFEIPSRPLTWVESIF